MIRNFNDFGSQTHFLLIEYAFHSHICETKCDLIQADSFTAIPLWS